MMRLKTKITSALSCPMKNTEHLQVLKYEPGQFYRSHHDQNSPYDSPAGPRIFTFFLYLSDVTEGGETYFPKLGLTVTPKSGSALVWASVSDDNIYTDDPTFLDGLHAAVKKLATKLDAPLLRSILNSYFGTVTRTVSNSAPKAIMLHMVRATQQSIHATIFDALGRTPLDGLLDESEDIDVKRRADHELLAKLKGAKRALESLA